MIYQLRTLAFHLRDGGASERVWREYTLEDRTEFLENPTKGIHAWWQETIIEANGIKCRGTTSPAARKKQRLLELASLLEACERNPELWHSELVQWSTAVAVCSPVAEAEVAHGNAPTHGE